MTAPAAILGTFVKMESISTRKQVRIQIEIPEEQADAVLEALGGYPRPSNPVWVAVARVTKEAAERASGAVSEPSKSKRDEHKNWTELTPQQQAGIRCNEPAFRQFLMDDSVRKGNGYLGINNEADAAAHVRLITGVKSRSEFGTNPVARGKWKFLERSYQIWLANPEG